MPELTWKSLRALHWKELYVPLHKYLSTGDLPTKEKSSAGLSRFKRVARHFELDEEGNIVLITNLVPPDLLDEEGKPLLKLELPLKFVVVKPTDKELTI